MGPTLCVQALGLSSYGLLEKKYNFTLNEMSVFGVTVNLTSVLEEAAMEASEKTNDDSKPSLWRRVFRRKS